MKDYKILKFHVTSPDDKPNHILDPSSNHVSYSIEVIRIYVPGFSHQILLVIGVKILRKLLLNRYITVEFVLET